MQLMQQEWGRIVAQCTLGCCILDLIACVAELYKCFTCCFWTGGETVCPFLLNTQVLILLQALTSEKMENEFLILEWL